jgi:hypothetical protein
MAFRSLSKLYFSFPLRVVEGPGVMRPYMDDELCEGLDTMRAYIDDDYVNSNRQGSLHQTWALRHNYSTAS